MSIHHHITRHTNQSNRQSQSPNDTIGLLSLRSVHYIHTRGESIQHLAYSSSLVLDEQVVADYVELAATGTKELRTAATSTQTHTHTHAHTTIQQRVSGNELKLIRTTKKCSDRRINEFLSKVNKICRYIHTNTYMKKSLQLTYLHSSNTYSSKFP
jgi:tRNA/tmRNA/rRNA uracil-C5-methylase (TrmA/RlmC/RlmD family)